MRNTNRHAIFAFAFFFFVSGICLAQQTDRVELNNGNTVSGVLQGYTVTNYVFETGNGVREIPRESVWNVKYWDVTEQLAQLEKAFQNRRYSRVVKLGPSVREQIDDTLRAVHRPRVLYYLAMAHFRLGNHTKALKIAKESLKNPGHVWFDHMARIRLLSKTYQVYDPEEDVTDATFQNIGRIGEELISLSESQEAPGEIVDYLKLLRVKALEQLGEGKLSITKVRYESIRDLSDPALRQRTFLGELRCLVRQNQNTEDMLATIRDQLESDQENELLRSGKLLATASNSIQKWQQEEKNVSHLREAVLSLVKAHLLFGTSTEWHSLQHRQLLYLTTKVYRLLAENPPKNGDASFFERQAEKTFEELRNRYTGSVEVQKVRYNWSVDQ